IATAGGAGYSPLAPGTCGTAVAVPLAWLAAPLPLWAFALVAAGITAVGIGAAELADRSWGTHDSGRIVIDEVAGYFITVAFADPTRPAVLGLGFVLFRLFDIVKPPPVRWIDRNLPGGAGVVLDDVAAGLGAGAVLLALDLAGLPAVLERWFP
ncbi:MAG TPA: phosphatidylglycerophosphatase A, partial [Kofleriaceae bacterium]|nr:phosphatidylglycerophosphatase A [Kofleriaceae bacterium]